MPRKRARPETRENALAIRAADVNMHISNRILTARRLAGLTQQELGKRVGISAQQMRKYEAGLNRISVGRLYSIARELHVSISWFYEDLNPAPHLSHVAKDREWSITIMHSVAGIESEPMLKALNSMARALAPQFSKKESDD